jgi:hypothetical protein
VNLSFYNIKTLSFLFMSALDSASGLHIKHYSEFIILFIIKHACTDLEF